MNIEAVEILWENPYFKTAQARNLTFRAGHVALSVIVVFNDLRKTKGA